MADISATMVKELREKSGAGMMECKKALVESQGDLDKAIEWLRQKGIASAGKKAARSASEGLVVGKVSADGKSGAIVEINCETDFVARNEQFQALAAELADLALANKVEDVDTLLAVKQDGSTVGDKIKEAVAKIGENIVVRRAMHLCVKGEGIVGMYIHALGGKIGALVKLNANKPVKQDDAVALAREVAMHTVSAKPIFLRREDVPADVLENERRIEMGKEDLAKKPPEIREKIVNGRVDKIVAERCLLEQPFVKDPNVTIAQLLKEKGGQLGAELEASDFVLFILGDTVRSAEGAES